MRILLALILTASVFAKSAKAPVKIVDAFYPCDYSVFWWAVKMSESSGNRFAVYHESFGETICPYHNKFGHDSLGLYQVSFEDAKGTRYSCPFKTRDDTFLELNNTICKDLIVDKLRAKYPEWSWSKSLGQYWSSLRRKEDWGRDYPGYLNFKAFALQKGCRIP